MIQIEAIRKLVNVTKLFANIVTGHEDFAIVHRRVAISRSELVRIDFQLFEQLKSKFGKIHTLVHSVAYAPAEELKNDFLFTTREGFRIAHDVSVYSLIALTRAAVPLMEDGGSVITMSYFGAEKVVPKYNVMGVAKASLEATVRYLAADVGQNKIRVNAISAGPIKTLAARGISGLGDMLKSHAERAPLKRNVEVTEVGATALFLASDLSTGITGEVIYVDCGYNIMGF